MTTLFVAATEAEARYLPASTSVLVTGIGKVAAATALTRRLAAYDAAELGELHIVNLGTAGALHPHLTGLFEIGTVLNHELSGDVLRSLGYDARERLSIGPADTVLATGDVFVTETEKKDIRKDQADCMGCLSQCLFWSWADSETNSTGRLADPRSFCIQKTLQDIAHGGPIDQNLMFAGHGAYQFKRDPFYSNGFVPTVKQLVDRILTGD